MVPTGGFGEGLVWFWFWLLAELCPLPDYLPRFPCWRMNIPTKPLLERGHKREEPDVVTAFPTQVVVRIVRLIPAGPKEPV